MTNVDGLNVNNTNPFDDLEFDDSTQTDDLDDFNIFDEVDEEDRPDYTY